MHGTKVLNLTVALLATLLLSSAAYADSIGIILTQTSQSGTAGTTVTFDATLTNLTTNTIFLNGDSSTTAALSLTVDDNPFLTNAPLSLAPGASTSTIALFSVLIAPGTAPGTYGFNTFSILGGLDGSGFDPVGTASFTVSVLSPVPEVDTFVMVASGLLGIGFRQWHQRRP